MTPFDWDDYYRRTALREARRDYVREQFQAHGFRNYKCHECGQPAWHARCTLHTRT